MQFQIQLPNRPQLQSSSNALILSWSAPSSPVQLHYTVTVRLTNTNSTSTTTITMFNTSSTTITISRDNITTSAGSSECDQYVWSVTAINPAGSSLPTNSMCTRFVYQCDYWHQVCSLFLTALKKIDTITYWPHQLQSVVYSMYAVYKWASFAASITWQLVCAICNLPCIISPFLHLQMCLFPSYIWIWKHLLTVVDVNCYSILFSLPIYAAVRSEQYYTAGPWSMAVYLVSGTESL